MTDIYVLIFCLIFCYLKSVFDYLTVCRIIDPTDMSMLMFPMSVLNEEPVTKSISLIPITKNKYLDK